MGCGFGGKHKNSSEKIIVSIGSDKNGKDPHDELNIESESKEIEDISQLKVSRATFIMENKIGLKNDYIIKEKIGEGGNGVVYTTLHKASGDIRAVKVIEQKGERFETESSLSKEISILKEFALFLL